MSASYIFTMSAHERNGWRDAWISDRHRQWNSNCPAVDLDGWVVAEYDNRIPVALIEYKSKQARLNIYDANNTALTTLANMAGLPLYIVVYDKDTLLFRVIPRNQPAEELLGSEPVTYSEAEYETFLLYIRGRKSFQPG